MSQNPLYNVIILLWSLRHYLGILKICSRFTHFAPYMNGILVGSSCLVSLLFLAVALSVLLPSEHGGS